MEVPVYTAPCMTLFMNQISIQLPIILLPFSPKLLLVKEFTLAIETLGNKRAELPQYKTWAEEEHSTPFHSLSCN